jgi:phosphate/phosphite/phosphonate ABC transporter binding protein
VTRPLPFEGRSCQAPRPFAGAVAQLGERLDGIQEVRGSIPLSSTPLALEKTLRRRHAMAVESVTLALRFAVVSSEPKTEAQLQRFTAELARATGISFEPRVVANNADLVSGMMAGELGVVWAAPLVAIELSDAGVATPVVVIERSSRGGYHSALFARSDSRFRKVEDLVDARVAWVSDDSASGYFVPRWHLRSMGYRLSHAFSSEQRLGSHEAVTRAVLAGEADVGATHVGLDPVSGNLVNAPWLALGADPSEVRVLLLVGPIPGDVIAVANGVDAPTRRRLVAALVAMKTDAAGRELFEAGRFDPVPDGHFELLRRLARFSDTRG